MLDLLAALKSLGVPLRVQCREIGLSPSALRAMTALRDPAARVPAAMMANLLAAAERYTGDPLVGVHAGERAEPRGPLAYLIMSTPHLGDGRAHRAGSEQVAGSAPVAVKMAVKPAPTSATFLSSIGNTK
jgi:hypothetical protein